MTDRQGKPGSASDPSSLHANRPNGLVVWGVTALALFLAIGFFYLTGDGRRAEPADALTGAAGRADDAVTVVGDAARNAADRLRDRN